MFKKIKIEYFILIFFIPTHGSIKEYLADIFSVNESNSKNFSWYSQDEETIKQSLCTLGLGLFKSISINDRFENKYDNYGFLINIKTIDESIQLKEPQEVSSKKPKLYYIATNEWVKRASKIPLKTITDQQKIIKIRKFLHLFCNINPFLSSEKIARKLHLNNYIKFHNHYIRYALKISLLEKTIDHQPSFIMDNSYLDFVDPFFKITTQTAENKECHEYNWTTRYYMDYYQNPNAKAFNLVVTQFSPETDNSDILDTISKNVDNSEISTFLKEEINNFIQNSLEHIIKIQELIKQYNKKENQKKIFESTKITVNLPNDIWNKIISFCTPESLADLMCINKQLHSLITNNSELIIKAAQELDNSIEFDERKRDDHAPWMDWQNTDKNKRKIIFNSVKIPLNEKNKNKIKVIRQFVHIINNNSKSSNETALELKLDNYCLFYNLYFIYAVKALAYINCFNTYYLKEYLKLWDKRFCFTILDGFFSEQYDRIIYLEMIPGRGLVVEPKAKANHNFSYNKIDLSKNDKNTYKDYYTINDILTLLKTKRGCLISDQCIEYFNNPTINTKNNLLEYEAQHENALITLQSYIRKYNAESLVLNYPNSIIKIQSYIRKRACYHQFIQLKQIKTYQKIKACQTMQNHIRRLIAEDNFHNEINKLKLIETQQKINAIITIQKYLRKVQAEILLETLNHHDSFVKHLDLISTNRYQHNLCKRAKLYQRIKILIYANAGLVITFFALYKIIQRLIND